MRLFLASYRFGAHRDRFVRMVGDDARIAVIANAADAWGTARASAVVSDLVPLRRLGFDAAEVDLRDYAGAPDHLRERLSEFGAVWVRGGNTFVLRAQLAACGGDEVLTELLRRDDVVYAGYSAGACVLAPSLRGLELADDPAEVQVVCGREPTWDGLGLIDFAIVPHHRSPGYSPEESALIDRIADGYRRAGTPHRTLGDDEVVVIGERD